MAGGRARATNWRSLPRRSCKSRETTKILNWIIALGILGDAPAEIVDVRESHTQLAYRVAAVWN